MTTQSNARSVLAARSALEALRNGVPNRDAVQMLGCNQPAAEDKFAELLIRATDTDNPSKNALWMLVSGGFGTGKSHLLTHLEEQALSQGFVCSKVAISKETPLFDLGKVSRSAVECGRMPDRNGRLIEELGQKLHPPSRAGEDFFRWAHETEANGLSQMFPATLRVHVDSGRDFQEDMEQFWAGGRIKVSRVKEGLSQVGRKGEYPFKAPKAAELPRQRLRFLTELIKGAGYKGWVVLLDEIELVGSYSLLQRGRSYAELTRWMGEAAGEDYPGLVVAGTVTDDFAAAIIRPDGQKKDRDYIKPKLESSKYAGLAARAETSMRLLEQGGIPLRPPTPEDLNDTVEKLRQIYTIAYGPDAPRLELRVGGAGYRNSFRIKVRAAINEWDLRRIDSDYQPDTVTQEYHPTYAENPDLEQESEDGTEDDLDSGPGPLRL